MKFLIVLILAYYASFNLANELNDIENMPQVERTRIHVFSNEKESEMANTINKRSMCISLIHCIHYSLFASLKMQNKTKTSEKIKSRSRGIRRIILLFGR